MRLLFSILGLIALTGCADTGAVMKRQSSDNTYYLHGDVDANSYKSIIDVLSKNQRKPVTFVVDSNGGWITGIENAMDAMRAHGQVHWIVPENGGCYSACALLGISAAKIDGTLNFHSPSSSYKNSDYMLTGRNEQIIQKIVSYGYNRLLVERLLNSVNIYSKLKFKDGVLQK